MPKVLNKYTATPVELANAVYIGRPSQWGNPFVIGRDGTRDEVIRKYRLAIEQSPRRMAHVREHLKGKDLVCFCAPQACHGDVLMEIANG